MKYEFSINRTQYHVDGAIITSAKFMCLVQIKMKPPLLDLPVEAKLDTAAAITVLPKHIWKDADIIFPSSVTPSFNELKTLKGPVSGKIGFIEMTILTHTSKEDPLIKVPAFLAENDSEASSYIVLGNAGFLEKYLIHIDQRKNQNIAFIDDN